MQRPATSAGMRVDSVADDELRAAVAAGVLGVEQAHRDLLRSIVETARAIFGAKASSVFLLDEEAGELVFEAVSGEGSDTLIGQRLPQGTGVAGWVLAARQPLVLDDVSGDPRFSREAAEATGYVPSGLMAVPLLHGDRALGVLQVLDRKSSRFSLAEMDLLGLFANQAAIALDLLQKGRRAQAALEGQGNLAVVARVATELDRLSEGRGEDALALLTALERVLRNENRGD
jgi:GAF domain-containing protein